MLDSANKKASRSKIFKDRVRVSSVVEEVQREKRKKLFDFYNNFDSKFMPGEHMGIHPDLLQVELVGQSECQYQSKSPFFGFDFESFDTKKNKGDDSSSESDAFKRIQKEKEQKKRSAHLAEMKKRND